MRRSCRKFFGSSSCETFVREVEARPSAAEAADVLASAASAPDLDSLLAAASWEALVLAVLAVLAADHVPLELPWDAANYFRHFDLFSTVESDPRWADAMEAALELLLSPEDQMKKLHRKENDVPVLEPLLRRSCGSTLCLASCLVVDGTACLPNRHHRRQGSPFLEYVLSCKTLRMLLESARTRGPPESQRKTLFSSASCPGPLARPLAVLDAAEVQAEVPIHDLLSPAC